MMTMTKLPAFSHVVDGDVGLWVEKDLINPNGLTHMFQVVFAEVDQGEFVSDADSLPGHNAPWPSHG
jgi:hypothetical protein